VCGVFVSRSELRPVSRSLSTPVFSSGVTGFALGSLTPCKEPVCARFGHLSYAHDVIAAVAMWSLNECAHCKAALAASARSRQHSRGTLPPPATVTNPATPLYVPLTPISTDSEVLGTSAASHAPNPDSPSIASDVPVTVADDELTTSVLTDGIGMLMDEQVMLGWGPVFDDGTTFCPVCRERFTPILHFRLWRACGSVESSQCLYMSPSLVRAELETLLNRYRHCNMLELADVLKRASCICAECATKKRQVACLPWMICWSRLQTCTGTCCGTCVV
jgi:hypothetical protein